LYHISPRFIQNYVRLGSSEFHTENCKRKKEKIMLSTGLKCGSFVDIRAIWRKKSAFHGTN
jgi:hypothetical protein